MWLLLFLSQQDFLINIHTMKHVVKIMVLLVAISACWIGLLQTSIIPRSHTWLVSFWFKFITYTSWVFLFIIELYIKKKACWFMCMLVLPFVFVGDYRALFSHSSQLPIYFVISLGCYGLLMVGVGLMNFPTCPQEALLLQQVFHFCFINLVVYC